MMANAGSSGYTSTVKSRCVNRDIPDDILCELGPYSYWRNERKRVQKRKQPLAEARNGQPDADIPCAETSATTEEGCCQVVKKELHDAVPDAKSPTVVASLSKRQNFQTNESGEQSPVKSCQKSSPAPTIVKKRADYLQWDEYFMALAFLSAQRSKDPSSQVGACVVNKQQKIVGIGYNGMPNGCHDDSMPWDRTGSWLETKYPYVCHAELNAILNKNSTDVADCKMYVALFPCNECSKLIIQSGIKEVIFYSDKYHDDDKMVASRKLFDMAGINYRQFKPKMDRVVIDFTSIEQKSAGPVPQQ